MADRRWKARRLAVGLAVAGICVLAGNFVATASAATWTARTLEGETVNLSLFGISCPTASLCVAVGANNTIASSSDPTAGPGSWKVVRPDPEPVPTPGGFYNGGQLRSIDCPTIRLCVAVSFEGRVLTSTDPNGAAAAWQVADLAPDGPNIHFYGVSCPTADFCAASAGGAKIATSTDPTGGPGAWTVTQLPGPMELRGISCASAALCVAVGDDGDTPRPALTDRALVVSSTDPLAGLWSAAPLPGRQNLYGASCPGTSLCVSGDTLGNLLVARNPSGGTGAWVQVPGGGSVQITDVECVSSNLCLAIDNNGDVLTSTDPDGGPEDWVLTNVIPFPAVDEAAANALWAATCPAPAFCAIAANGGQILTATDPFAPSPEEAQPNQRHGQRHGGKPQPKRPLVRIAHGPGPVELVHGNTVTIQYRFFALHHVQVRGFVCKLDSRPLKSCRSPKAYRVGRGLHKFRVRAVGLTGLRGRVDTDWFRVCRPTPYPQCMRHLPPPHPPPASEQLASPPAS